MLDDNITFDDILDFANFDYSKEIVKFVNRNRLYDV